MSNTSSKTKNSRTAQVQQIMNQPAVTCRPQDSLNFAAQQMWEHDCGAVPVVDESGRAVAIVTDRDIAMAAYMQGKPLAEIPVSSAMATELFCCGPEDSLDTAETLMRDKQVRRLPVIDGEGKPVGVLSLGDVARHGAPSIQRGQLEHEVTKTLAAICAPRAEAMEPSWSKLDVPHATA